MAPFFGLYLRIVTNIVSSGPALPGAGTASALIRHIGRTDSVATLPGKQPCINHQGGAGNETGPLRRQVENRVGHVLRLDPGHR